MYISGHPLSKFASVMSGFSLTSDMLTTDEDASADDDEEIGNADENGLQDGMSVTCGGIITEVKKMISKRSGKEMAFVTVEDLYGTIEVVFWQNMFQKFKDLLVVDNIVKVAGKLSVREGVKPSVMVDNIEKMTSGAEPKQVAPSEKPKTLYLKFNTKDDSLKNEILDILKSYPGTSNSRWTPATFASIWRPFAMFSPLVILTVLPSGSISLTDLTQSLVGPYLNVRGPDALVEMLPPMEPCISVGSTG